MDLDTAAAIERLSDSIVRLEQSSRGDGTQLRGDMAQLRVDLREALAEDRRHTSALFESLRAEIRVLGSAIATFSTKLDSLQR